MYIEKLFSSPIAVTFDDIVVLPGYSDVEPHEVEIRSRFTRSIGVAIPIVSAPMDTVTGEKLAMFLAGMGTIGVIHRHCSVDHQVKMVKNVKNADIYQQIPKISVDSKVEEIPKLLKMAPDDTALILDGDFIVGIARKFDIYLKEHSISHAEWNTVGDLVVFLREKQSMSILLNLNGENVIVEIYFRPTRPLLDSDGRPMVAAAVSPFQKDRIREIDRHVDAIVFDVAHFHTERCLQAAREITGIIESDLVVGNIGTYEATEDIITSLEKVDGLRVGIGSGSICKTSVLTGIFAPTLFATIEAAEALHMYGLKIPIISDGGIRSASDALKALVFGASCVMAGRFFAGCSESLGPLVKLDDRYYKMYRGMGSASVKIESMLDRYSRVTKTVAEGVEGLVEYKGTVIWTLHEFSNQLRIAMGYAGARNIRDLRHARIAFILHGGRREMQPHDIIAMKTSEFLKNLASD